MNGYTPIIVIGAGRSGTTLLTQILEKLGVYVGARRTPTFEALFFQGLNKWLLAQAGANEDNPEGFRYFLDDLSARTVMTNAIRATLRSPAAISYLGARRYARYRSPAALDFPWGWKDPRNTYTLPVWLDLFPLARVIHITRHGVDVANSLKTVHDRTIAAVERHVTRWRRLYLLYLGVRTAPRRRRLVNTRAASLDSAFAIWEAYVSLGRQHVTALGPQAFEVRYEDLVEETASVLRDLADFCGLAPDEESFSAALGLVKPTRAYAFLAVPQLTAFARAVADRLETQGYEDLVGSGEAVSRSQS